MPSVLIAKGTMDNALRSLRTAKWQFLPSLGLYGGWSTSYYTYPGKAGYTPIPYWNQFRNNGGEYVQLSLNIPIYDRLQKYTTLSKRKTHIRGPASNMTNPFATSNRKSAGRFRTGTVPSLHCFRRKDARTCTTRHTNSTPVNSNRD